MKLSARYHIEGRVVAISRGDTAANVKLEITPGNFLAASLPNEQLEEMGLRLGMLARASVHASTISVGRR